MRFSGDIGSVCDGAGLMYGMKNKDIKKVRILGL